MACSYISFIKKLHSSINFWLVLLAVKCGEIWVGYYCHCAATLGRLATLVEGMTTMTLKLIKNRLKLLEAPAISPLASRENWQWKETSIIPTSQQLAKGRVGWHHNVLKILKSVILGEIENYFWHVTNFFIILEIILSTMPWCSSSLPE